MLFNQYYQEKIYSHNTVLLFDSELNLNFFTPISCILECFPNTHNHQFPWKKIIFQTRIISDPNIMKKSGKTLLTTWVAAEFGFSDIDGTYHYSPFSLKNAFIISNHPWLAAITPSFIRIPMWLAVVGAHLSKWNLQCSPPPNLS